MRLQNRWRTAVTLLLLLVLAACGGGEGAGDVEATGSESVGDILPTPITGAKVWPTRANAASLTPDILIIVPSSMLTAVDLNGLPNQAALPNARYALALYGDTAPIGIFDFMTDMGELTAVLDTTNAPDQLPLTLPEALAAGLQLPGWRPDSLPRLILVVVDEEAPVAEEMMALATTAVAQYMRLYIWQREASADWAEVAEVGNGRVLLLPDNQTPGILGNSLASLVAEALMETAP